MPFFTCFYKAVLLCFGLSGSESHCNHRQMTLKVQCLKGGNALAALQVLGMSLGKNTTYRLVYLLNCLVIFVIKRVDVRCVVQYLQSICTLMFDIHIEFGVVLYFIYFKCFIASSSFSF